MTRRQRPEDGGRRFSRRELLRAAGGAILAPGAGAFARLDPLADSSALAPLVAAFRANQSRPPLPFQPTGLSRGDYARVIRGIVAFFARCQDARGAVIDPWERAERQYSTPAFALAAAALCKADGDEALLPAARRAMEAAAGDLAAGKTADGHADFFTVLLVHADRLLAPLGPPAEAERWRASLRAVVPEKIYRVQPASERLNNWNLVAAAGEWLRTRDGFGDSGPWVNASLARHVGQFTATGMYRDPADPMAYDHFARLWALDLIEDAYRGEHAAPLRTALDAGAWTSLFMQSPHGEMPCGGRSAHHQWNEAQQAVTFETYARRMAREGDGAAAGAFKRAARLSLRSMTRWVRPTGELWIVKNRVDPDQRHGYEVYSFHSQYNLLAAAMLALAWLRADETIAERPCPADVGGYAFALQPAFHKVFVAAGGYHVEIDTASDPSYNPTGILRVHHREMPPETLSDGVSARCVYRVPTRPTRSLAFGPEWQDAAGKWHSLAEHSALDLDEARVRVVEARTGRAEVEIIYRGRLRGGAQAVVERVTLSRDGVEVCDTVDGEVAAVRQTVPILASDGRRETQFVPAGRKAIEVRVGGDGQAEPAGGRLWVTSGGGVARTVVREPCRNGFADALVVNGEGRTVQCRVSRRQP